MGALESRSEAGGEQADTKQWDVRAAQAGNFLRQHTCTYTAHPSIRMGADSMTRRSFDIPFVARRQGSARGIPTEEY